MRSVSDLPQHNTVTYSLEESICIGIHGEHMFTVRVVFQRCVDPVHKSKPLLLWIKKIIKKDDIPLTSKNIKITKSICYHYNVMGFRTWYYYGIV